MAGLVLAWCLSSLALAQTVTDYPLHTIGGKDTFITQTSPYGYFGRAEYLLVGGTSGYLYWGMMSWDMTKLPTLASGDKAELVFYGLNISGYSPTEMQLGMSATPWTDADPWKAFSWYSTLLKIVPATPYNNWMAVDITNWYNYWKNGQIANNGILFLPTTSANKYTAPASTEVSNLSIRPFVRVTKAAPPSAKFLDFPVSGYGPFSQHLISTVLDHDVPHDTTSSKIPFGSYSDSGPFGHNGAVLSFTGELFTATNGFYAANDYSCYPKSSNANQTAVWSSLIQIIYGGTDAGNCKDNVAMNYDNHPGYDYKTPEGSNVYPAADGVIIQTRCIRTFADYSTCEDYGAVAVDHGNGYVTQYLHMKNAFYGTASGGIAQKVYRVSSSSQTLLGNVSNKGLKPTNGPHLHFEVLKRKAVPVDTANYYNRANYMIVDPYGYKPDSPYADKLLANPGCLWNVGCQY